MENWIDKHYVNQTHSCLDLAEMGLGLNWDLNDGKQSNLVVSGAIRATSGPEFVINLAAIYRNGPNSVIYI